MPKKAKLSRALAGRYLGLMRHAKRTVKAKARALRSKKGIRSAIAYLRASSK